MSAASDIAGAPLGGSSGRLPPILRALAAALASAVALSAQGPPPEAPVTASPASTTAPPVDPFDSAPPIQAERLRGLRPEIVRAILRGEPGGEIAVAVLGCPLPATGDQARVALFVEMDGGSFLDANQASVAPVEIYAYALNLAGAVTAYLAEGFTLDVARHGEAVWNGGLRFVGWLELPPGTYQLRVMVHNARSLAHGVTFARLEVPAAADRSSLPPLLIPGPGRRRPWLAVRGRAGWPPDGGAAYPFAVDGRPLLPAAWPVLVGGRATEAHVFVGRLPEGPLSGSVELLAAAAADRHTARPIVVSSAAIEAGPSPQRPGAPSSLDMRFPAPAAAPGVYGLRARIESWEGELITATLPVLVIDARPQDRALLWTDLKALSGRTGPVAPDETTAGRATEPAQPRRAPKRQASRRIAARYRQALAAAASAARPTALLEFETATLSASGDEPLLQLRAAELLAASNLGRVRVDLLLPVISLHDELFHLYGRRRLVSLVAHTRHLLEELAELYAELGGKPETAAAVLASVGGYMQQMRAFGDSRQLFELALAHKADNAPALLGLAASSEKYGKYLEAVQRLEQLVAARPDLDEARLRLAINLERIGDRQRFRDLLGDIVNGPGTGWVSSIACQELARSLLEAGALDEAAALLEGALERMPDRQALWILMAHVRDRQGQLAQSWESLRRVATAPAGDDRSDRLTYDDWANGPLDEARAALRDGAAALRTALDAELGGGGAAGP